MIKGNVNFHVNIDLHYNEDYDETIVEHLNTKIASREFREGIKDLLEYYLIEEPDGSIEISDYEYTKLTHYGKTRISELDIGECFILNGNGNTYRLINGNFTDDNNYVFICFRYGDNEFVGLSDAEVVRIPEERLGV